MSDTRTPDAAIVHTPVVRDVSVVVRTRSHAGRVYPIRRNRHRLDCSCGVTLGVALDWIDTNRKWREHVR